jgi:formate dehydrogenase gamma subunit
MTETTQGTEKRAYRRFSAAERFEHIVLLVTFIGLTLTGMPQRYADAGWAQSLIAALGGIESIRIVHRILATILMAEAIYHGGIISYKLFVLGRRASMMPGFRDVRDAWQWVLYNLGLRREHPKMPRYNFGEKAEYLAVVWGTVVMIITGFMMWNPIATANILPGAVIPAARAAHSAEALLAAAAIVLWHFYSVLLRGRNRSIFTGNLSRAAMAEEHAEELEALERGEKPRENPPEVIQRRKRAFVPYAVIVTIVLVGGLIVFVTFEQTAITTLSVRQTTINFEIDAEAGAVEPGSAAWTEQQCVTCHGELADGSGLPIGVSIVERDLTLEDFITAVRTGPADMPAYTSAKLSDVELANLWAWLNSLRS